MSGVFSPLPTGLPRPGSVVPCFEREGEWTFYFFVDGQQIWDDDENRGRSFTRAYAAKAAMRERCGIS